MTVLYTDEDIQNALRQLRIKPVKGLVSTREAASILTWRAMAEQGVEHQYPESAVRRHVERGTLKVAQKLAEVANFYKVEDVFEIPLTPNRGLKQKKLKDAA